METRWVKVSIPSLLKNSLHLSAHICMEGNSQLYRTVGRCELKCRKDVYISERRDFLFMILRINTVEINCFCYVFPSLCFLPFFVVGCVSLSVYMCHCSFVWLCRGVHLSVHDGRGDIRGLPQLLSTLLFYLLLIVIVWDRLSLHLHLAARFYLIWSDLSKNPQRFIIISGCKAHIVHSDTWSFGVC